MLFCGNCGPNTDHFTLGCEATGDARQMELPFDPPLPPSHCAHCSPYCKGDHPPCAHRSVRDE